MGKYVTNESKEIIIGWEPMARHLGVCSATVRKWYREEAFPVGVLPDGRYMTTKNLVEQWIMARSNLSSGHQTRMLKARAATKQSISKALQDKAQNGLGTPDQT